MSVINKYFYYLIFFLHSEQIYPSSVLIKGLRFCLYCEPHILHSMVCSFVYLIIWSKISF